MQEFNILQFFFKISLALVHYLQESQLNMCQGNVTQTHPLHHKEETQNTSGPHSAYGIRYVNKVNITK